MATNTAGTLATTTLTAIQWFPGYQGAGSTHATDFATMKAGVARDAGPPKGSYFGNPSGPVDAAGNKTNVIQPGAVSSDGWLTLPGGRGTVKLIAGDWIGVDGFGNLFLIPQRALPKTLTATCTGSAGSPAVTSSTDLRTLGWQNGTHITSSHTPSGSVIGDLAPDGKSFNIYAFATGLKANSTSGAGAETFTAGTFTHS